MKSRSPEDGRLSLHKQARSVVQKHVELLLIFSDAEAPGFNFVHYPFV
eukprot:CAMPEP_0168350374 /NCGR_PEP_ID=MMETSP0213-20121227/21077_1 /TAXON_ID=151035 /ORGANISM="Euplotes harpa, Strain FSP1.4" /LENGTH=47 /DNA_ID= /DNA_START= /DNA_END= /DNA_ORIENTATION=